MRVYVGKTAAWEGLELLTRPHGPPRSIRSYVVPFRR